jgi:hypothetical protein
VEGLLVLQPFGIARFLWGATGKKSFATVIFRNKNGFQDIAWMRKVSRSLQFAGSVPEDWSLEELQRMFDTLEIVPEE